MEKFIEEGCGNCRQPFVLKGDGSRHLKRIPLLLDCGHTLCGHCISRTKAKVLCPTCGVLTPYNNKEPPEQQFVPNMCVLGRVAARHLGLRCVPSYSPVYSSFLWAGDELREQGLPPPELGDLRASVECDSRCEECDKVAQSKCIQCNGFYCSTCFKVLHATSNSLRRHTSIPAIQASTPPPSCPQHPSHSLTYYCSTDKTPLCSDCILASHKAHEVIPIREAAESHRERVHQLVTSASTTIDQMRSRKQEISSQLTETRRVSLAVCRSMEQQMRELYTILQMRELTLHKEVASRVDDQVAPILEMEKKLSENMTRVSTDIITASELLKSDVRLLQNSQTLHKVLGDVDELVPRDIPPLAPVSFSLPSSVREDIEQAGLIVVNTPPVPVTGEETSRAAATGDVPLADSGKYLSSRQSLTPSPSRFGHSSPLPSSLDRRHSPSPVFLRAEPYQLRKNSRSSLSPFCQPYTPKKSSRESSLQSGRSISRSRTASPVPVHVRLEDTVEVWVSHVETPGEFYVHRKKEENDLQRMCQTLNELCSQGPCGVNDVCEGMKVAAKFSQDDLWYRAEVLTTHLTPPPSYVTVQYLDYGNSENVTLDQLMSLPTALSGPFFSHKCAFSGLQPPGRFSNVAPPSWSQNAITQFKNMVDRGDLRMKECCRNEFGWQEVELFISSSDGLHSVSENLLQMGLAARVKKRDKVVPLPKIPPLSLPKLNETVDVIVSTPLDPNNFYVQLISSSDALGQLMTDLQDQVLRLVDSPYKGQACISRYADDKQLYRAVVSEAAHDGLDAEVQYVDYGNFEEVKEVWEMPPELMSLPAQAIHCSLNDVVPVSASGVWPQQVTNTFTQYTDGVLAMTVCQEGVPLPVILTHKETAQQIGTLLVVQGMARPVSNDKRKRAKRPIMTVSPPTPLVVSPRAPTLPLRGMQPVQKTTPLSTPARTTSSSIPRPTLPAVGDSLECVVVQVDSPGQFFVQPTSSRVSASQLTSLLARIPPQQPSRQTWSSSESCLAMFSGEKWHRAEVLTEAPEGAGYEVLYVDFGNVAVLPASELAIMPPALEKFPALVLKAALAGVRPLDQQSWSYDTSLSFSKLVLDKEVTVTVQALPPQVHPSLPIIVSLNTNGVGSDISSVLLSEKWALPYSADSVTPGD